MIEQGGRLWPSAARSFNARIRAELVGQLYNLNLKSAEAAWTARLSAPQADEHIDVIPQADAENAVPGTRMYKSKSLFKCVGCTVAVKDNIVTSQFPTSCASNILRGYNTPEEATIVRRMRAAGLVVLGKTNMDEFGMGSHSRHSAFGPLQNAQDQDISVGGSSGGSALLVARGLAHYGIGTDTGGSVRLPAAYLNIAGFKPSYGLISRYGVVPYANSLDTVGLLSRSCTDLIDLFSLLSRPDDKDPTCLSYPSRHRMRQTNRRSSLAMRKRGSWYGGPRRIGVPLEYNIAEMQNGVRSAWMRALNLLEAQGHEIVPISLPTTQQALSAYYVLAPAEASSNLAKYDGVRYGPARNKDIDEAEGALYSSHRGSHFGEEVKRRILLGAYSLSAGAMDNYFLQAQKVRRLVQQDFIRAFRSRHPLLHDAQPGSDAVDFIVCPTAPNFPPTIASLSQASPLEAYTNDIFTVPASLAGLPAVSVPAPMAPEALSSRPERAVGIQVIGQYGNDYGVLEFAAYNFEDQEDWSRFHTEHRRMIR